MAHGGYRFSLVTYQTILVLHFVLPFVVMGVMALHLNFLHLTGRTNLLCSHRGLHKIRFYPYYWGKDAINILVYLLAFIFILLFPYSLREVVLFEGPTFLTHPYTLYQSGTS